MTTFCLWVRTALDGLSKKNEDLDVAITSGNKEVQKQIIYSMEKMFKSIEDFIHRQVGR